MHMDEKRKKRPEEPIAVLCYGDSNTYGYDPRTDGERYPSRVCWTTILAEMLGSDYKIIPEGLSGRTTAYDRIDAPWKNGLPYLTPCLATHKPVDYLTIMLGTNDCNVEMGLSAEDIAAGMEQLVATAETVTLTEQGYVPRIVVIVPAAIRPEIEGTTFDYQLDETSVEKSRAIAPLYRDIARRHGCLFLDASAVETSPIDCEHLTEQGHTQMAQLLFDLLQKDQEALS